MAITQDKNYKDQLLIVDASQIGIRDRGVEPQTPDNAIIDGNVVNFHPMVRENWGTEDPLRGALGSYYVRYRGSLGETLINYSNVLDYLEGGGDPAIGAFDRNPNGSKRTGKLARQLVGNNNNTNIIFQVLYFSEGAGEVILLRSNAGWDSYQTSPLLPANWYVNNFEKYVKGAFNPNDRLIIPNFDRPGQDVYRYSGLLNDDNFIKKQRLDHTSVHYLISSERSIRQESGVTTDVEPVYNFYVASNPDYEAVIADPRVEEYLIPNSYYLQLELQNTSSTYLDQYHQNALTINNQVPWFGYLTNTEINIDSYYNLYSDNILQALTDEAIALPLVKEDNGDVAVLHSDLAVLDENSILTETIPFYNKLTIGHEADEVQPGPTQDSYLQTLIGDPLTRDFVDILQAHCVKLISNENFDNNSGAPFTTKETTRLVPGPSQADVSFRSEDRSYPVLFDLEAFITAASSAFFSNTISAITIADEIVDNAVPNAKFLRDYFGKDDLGVDPVSADEVVGGYYAGNYLSKFKRTLEEVYNGDPCHSETLLYIVDKYRVTGDTEEKVQSFYISPRLSGVLSPDIVYYDSQVKYNQKYRYDFKKVVLVFGNAYQFDIVNIMGAMANARILAKFINNLSIKALIVPYSFEGIQASVIDKPPVSPEISFYPMKGVDTRVKVLLNSSTGNYTDKPIAILDSDKQLIEEEYLGQTGVDKTYEDIRSSGSKIRYISDDPVDKYQLFRINTEPTSYEDFNNNFVEIDPDVGTPGYFEDIIVPNRKYYYCARSVDIHGNISNPTYIFEIEMFNNEGQIYLRQQVFTFKAEKPSYVKQGRRFIYIEPSFQQVALDPNTNISVPSDPDEKPQDSLLGVAGSKCWQEKFKIRVTSKKTGRKMDLNITFKNSGVTNPS
jgi:hypothetical protein